MMNTGSSSNSVSFIEMLQNFSYYKNLIEHLYTDKNTIRFNQIFKVLDLDKKWNDSFNSTELETKNEIENILSKLSLNLPEKPYEGIVQVKKQWINLELLNDHLNQFVSTTRMRLIPISQKHDSLLYQVRISDRRGYEDIGQDVIAELSKEDAEILTNELEKLSDKLKQKNTVSRIIYAELNDAKNDLKQMINEMLLGYELTTIPIRGSCDYCRNEEFWSKNSIDNDEEKIKTMPSIIDLLHNYF